jgi:predicted transposase YbfD/YdcC
MNNIFIECFSKVTDPRVERHKKHLLIDIIALTLFGIMSGAQTFDEIELFGEIHEEWLKKYLQLPNGIPSHDTINRTLSLLDPGLLQKSFIDWIGKVKGYVNENVIAIDGKTMKASHQNSKGLKALHILSAYSCANGLSLGQMKVDGKTNEITVIPQLIEQLAIEGAIITIDAMGCQKDIAEAIVKKKADYILAVKGNQKELFEPIVDTFRLTKAEQTFEHEINGDHGRIESRKVEAFDVEIIKSQLDLNKWTNIASIICVTYNNHTKKSEEKRYFISTLPHQEVERIAHAIRSHWQIENNLHWVLDVVFKEDDSRIRNERAALNFSWFRKMALGLLSKDTEKGSYKRKMLKNWAAPENLIKSILNKKEVNL